MLDWTLEALLERRHMVREGIMSIIGKIEDLLPVERPRISELKELLGNLIEYRDVLKMINREVQDTVDIN